MFVKPRYVHGLTPDYSSPCGFIKTPGTYDRAFAIDGYFSNLITCPTCLDWIRRFVS